MALDWLRRRLGPTAEQKASATGRSVALYNVGQPVYTPRRYDRLAEESYLRNAVAYRCTKLISENGAAVPLKLTRLNKGTGSGGRRKRVDVEQHELLDLLKRPNPMGTGHTVFEAFYAYLLLAGNTYLEGVGPNGRPPREIWNLRPDRMRVVPGKTAIPQAYQYEVNGVRTTWEVDLIRGKSPILHLKQFHPLNDWYGMSPVEAAAYAVDRHNAAGAHNTALLQNGCRPSGALVLKPVSTGQGGFTSPDETVIKQAEARLKEQHSGAVNAGRPFVMSGDITWVDMMLSPKDMDFGEGKADAARDICLAFGVPHLLIVPGQSTYNNVKEAKLELTEETVLPLVDKSMDGCNGWLTPLYGDDLKLEADKDELPALEPRRMEKRASIIELWDKGLIKRNEAREGLQYDDMDDVFELNPDATVLTALIDAYDKNALPIEAIWRYARGIGLIDESMSDDKLLADLREQAERRQAEEPEDEEVTPTGKPNGTGRPAAVN